MQAFFVFIACYQNIRIFETKQFDVLSSSAYTDRLRCDTIAPPPILHVRIRGSRDEGLTECAAVLFTVPR